MKGIVFPSAESTQVSLFSAIEFDGLATLRPSTSTTTGTGLLSLSNWSARGLDSQKKKLQLQLAERIDDALRTARGEVYHWTITALQLLVLMLCPLATYPSQTRQGILTITDIGEKTDTLLPSKGDWQRAGGRERRNRKKSHRDFQGIREVNFSKRKYPLNRRRKFPQGMYQIFHIPNNWLWLGKETS